MNLAEYPSKAQAERSLLEEKRPNHLHLPRDLWYNKRNQMGLNYNMRAVGL